MKPTKEIQPANSDFRLFTSHGTVMFVDAASGELRHGPLMRSPFNVVLVRMGEQARLKVVGAEGQDIVFLEEYSAIVGSEKLQGKATVAGTSVFSYVPAPGKEFGLSQNGLFVSAEPDGRIALRAPHLRDWEMFHARNDASELGGTIVSYRIDGQMIRFFITKRSEWIQHNQCRGDFYEREGLDVMRSHCHPERAFVDIGANIGNHAVFISKFCRVSDVIVFEPYPIAIELLRINLALNACLNVDTRYLGFALGSESKTLRALPVQKNLGGTQMEEDNRGDTKCIPGDEVLLQKPVGFIKLDVEGMEFDVLKGIHRTIERWRPKIFLEVKSDLRKTLRAWCAEFDYDVRQRLAWDNFLLVSRRPIDQIS